ncbi:Integrase [Roseivivax halotolerans]|uniref:Integrase n=1 Tax=Roseivivax halotolerans TaxID=93684 RepID=A0A1I5ZGY7_9RHOB|nr:site-specific integrase [Roseivivax halotolerans]SFQ55744.1 Integrase [Roseivivax halotolerans]
MAQLHKLTSKQVEHARQPGRISDGGGLYLTISKAGSRSWLFMFRVNGKRREMGLGSAAPGGVTLAQARKKAAEARDILQDGGDPLEQRQAAQRVALASSTTFGEFADQFVEDQRGGWSNPKHAAQWAMTLGPAYCKKIRTRAIADVDIEDVVAVLRPVWLKKPETARRIRMRLERVLDAAKVRGLRSGENPARWRGNLELLLPKQPKADGHHAAMPWADVPAFMEQLAAREGVAALALRWTILTAARTSEVLYATWDEIDVDAGIWEVPAERMKARRPHRVPLSDEALAVLEEVKGLDPELVFPAIRGSGPMSNMAMSVQLRRMKVTGATVHGFRSSFRDWAAEATSFQSEVAEMALAHVIGNRTEAAYRRGDLFEKRRRLMEAWGRYCTSSRKTDVVSLARGAGRS